MLYSSSFHFRKPKNMSPRDYHRERKLTARRCFHDVSHMKLTDIFKTLRRRNVLLRRDSQRLTRSLTRSQSFPPPFSDHDDSSPVHWHRTSPDISTSPRPPVPHHRSDAASILSATEEDCSSGMSTSGSYLEDTAPNVATWGHGSTTRSVPPLAASPSMFQLRSVSAKDYVVERLEQHLGQLSLADTSSDHDIAMNVYLANRNLDALHMSLPQTVRDSETTSSCCTLKVPDGDAQKPVPLLHNQNIVPMILITSADAKHAKPLPPSPQRPTAGRTPFAPSNFVNRPTNANASSSAKSKRKTITPPDDPFTTQPQPHCDRQHGIAASSHPTPHDDHLTFRLPSFNLNSSAFASPTKRTDPETPTPMCCDHFGECTGDLWEVLHPPLIPASRFTLPPFELPPLSRDLFHVSRLC